MIADVGIISFERKKNYDYSNQVDSYVSLIMGELQGNIIGYNESTFKLQATGGVNFGFTGKLEAPDLVGSPSGQGIGIGGGVKYGLNMNQAISPSSSITLGVTGFSYAKSYVGYLSPEVLERRSQEKAQYMQADSDAIAAQKQWDQNKYDWEVANGYGSAMETNYYMSASGAGPRPEDAEGRKNFRDDAYWVQNVSRTSFILNPSITYLKSLPSGKEFRVNVNANLVVKDQLKGKDAGSEYSGRGTFVNSGEFIHKSLTDSTSLNRVNLSFTFVFETIKTLNLISRRIQVFKISS